MKQAGPGLDVKKWSEQVEAPEGPRRPGRSRLWSQLYISPTARHRAIEHTALLCGSVIAEENQETAHTLDKLDMIIEQNNSRVFEEIGQVQPRRANPASCWIVWVVGQLVSSVGTDKDSLFSTCDCLL